MVSELNPLLKPLVKLQFKVKKPFDAENILNTQPKNISDECTYTRLFKIWLGRTS